MVLRRPVQCHHLVFFFLFEKLPHSVIHRGSILNCLDVGNANGETAWRSTPTVSVAVYLTLTNASTLVDQCLRLLLVSPYAVFVKNWKWILSNET